MRRWTVRVASIAAMLAVVPAMAIAQHEHGGGGAVVEAALCGQAQPVVARTLDAAMGRLETARQSNGAAAMRAAVEEFALALVALKTLLAPCAAPQPAVAAVEKPAGTSAAAAMAITFRTQGAPVTGDSVFEVTVKDAAGQAVTDAGVSVVIFMAAMPAINMPAMRDETTLGHTSGGMYRGQGQIMMAGPWDVTVTVTRSGQRISERFGMVAK